jgi:glycosyltransferase involved in cell wall biosynthesis
VTLDSIAEGVGTSQIKNLVLKLNSLGIKITLVSFEKTPPSHNLIEEMQSAGIKWHPLKFGRFGTIYGVLRVLRLKWKICFLREVDLYHCRSDLAAFACLTAFKTRPVLWDVRSFWADQKSVIDDKNSRFMNAILRYIEKKCAHNARAVNLLTNRSIEVLKSRNGIIPSICSVIPTCVDLSLFNLRPKNSLNLKCLLSGTINDFYDIDLISSFIQTAMIEFQIKTTWVRPIESQQCFEFPEIWEMSTALYHEMPSIVADHSFGLILCKSNEISTLSASSPTKAAEFLATGRPLLVSPNIGDLSQLIVDNRVGVVLDKSTAISRTIKELIELISDPGLPQRCRDVAEMYYDLEKASISYKDVYEEMLEERII